MEKGRYAKETGRKTAKVRMTAKRSQGGRYPSNVSE